MIYLPKYQFHFDYLFLPETLQVKRRRFPCWIVGFYLLVCSDTISVWSISGPRPENSCSSAEMNKMCVVKEKKLFIYVVWISLLFTLKGFNLLYGLLTWLSFIFDVFSKVFSWFLRRFMYLWCAAHPTASKCTINVQYKAFKRKINENFPSCVFRWDQQRAEGPLVLLKFIHKTSLCARNA